jgi:RNA polymerase sigma-70 factor (ECF subfamily)
MDAPLMSSDSAAKAGSPQWSRLIFAIASNQDQAAFSELFEYFAPRIKAFMLRLGMSEARAEELAQETMLAVWRKASLFDPATLGASAWIFTIARNLRIDAYRGEQRGAALDPSDIEAEFHIDTEPQPDAKLAAVQAEERVRSALSQLSADQKRVVELSFFEDKAHGEISEILKVPLGTVKSRLRLAMSRLRSLLGEVR